MSNLWIVVAMVVGYVLGRPWGFDRCVQCRAFACRMVGGFLSRHREFAYCRGCMPELYRRSGSRPLGDGERKA